MSSDRDSILSRVRSALAPLPERAALPDWERELVIMRNARGAVDAVALFSERLVLVNGTPLTSAADLVALLEKNGWRRGYCDPALWPGLQAAFPATFTVETFRTYSNADNFVHVALGYVPVLVTVDRPHNLIGMTMLTFTGPDGPGGSLTIPITGGGASSVNFNNYTMGIHYDPAYMDSDQFVLAVQADGTAVDGVVSLAATCSRPRRYFPPIAHMISLCNELGSDLWLNIPPVAPHVRSDATIAAIVDEIAAGLDEELSLWVEPFNEPWNFAFPPFHYIRQYAHKIGATHAGGYAALGSHWHSVSAARWAAAGRNMAKFFRVFGTFTGVPSYTSDLAAYCAAHGIPVDCVGLAPYWYLQPELQPSLTSVYDALTGEQVLDLAEVWQLWGQDVVLQNAADHRAALASYGFNDAFLYCYEMGPAYARLGGTNTHQAQHSQYCHKSPRFAGVLFNYYKALQDRGVRGGDIYAMMGGYAAEGGAAATSMYGMFSGCDMRAGKGDGTDGEADNRVDPYTVHTKASVVGYTLKAWNAGLAAPPPPPPPPPRPPRSRSRAGRGFRLRHC